MVVDATESGPALSAEEKFAFVMSVYS